MKEIKFSTANHPDQWWADDFGGVIKFASAIDAKEAEALFAEQADNFAKCQAKMTSDFSKDCATLARYIRHDAPKHVKEIALGWIKDDDSERETP